MATAIIIIAIMALFVGAWFVVQIGKERNAQDNLIYLEFLIRNCQTDAVSRRAIQKMLIDYGTRPEYWGDKFNELNKLFREKFKIEETRKEFTPKFANKN